MSEPTPTSRADKLANGVLMVTAVAIAVAGLAIPFLLEPRPDPLSIAVWVVLLQLPFVAACWPGKRRRR